MAAGFLYNKPGECLRHLPRFAASASDIFEQNGHLFCSIYDIPANGLPFTCLSASHIYRRKNENNLNDNHRPPRWSLLFSQHSANGLADVRYLHNLEVIKARETFSSSVRDDTFFEAQTADLTQPLIQVIDSPQLAGEPHSPIAARSAAMGLSR